MRWTGELRLSLVIITICLLTSACAVFRRTIFASKASHVSLPCGSFKTAVLRRSRRTLPLASGAYSPPHSSSSRLHILCERAFSLAHSFSMLAHNPVVKIAEVFIIGQSLISNRRRSLVRPPRWARPRRRVGGAGVGVGSRAV